MKSNYIKIEPMTFEERVVAYMKMNKLELARMMAQRDQNDIDWPFTLPGKYVDQTGKPVNFNYYEDSSGADITVTIEEGDFENGKYTKKTDKKQEDDRGKRDN